MSSTVLMERPQFVPQIDNKSTYKDEKTGKTYFKVFLLNNKINKRKFKITNLKNLHTDVDGYENLPVTFVKEGIRKGNHPSPKDDNIFEANYQNRYTYISKAIEYYRKFGIAKIVKIFKPDPNLLTASSNNDTNVLNYFALCETNDPVMLELLASAEKEDKNIYVSPAMFSWDWNKDTVTGQVSVNSFIPTHLAIVDSPAYDPEIAYIKKQTCQKDGISCYYELFEASDIENLNNDTQQPNDMSTNKFPTSLEEYVKSYWNLDVVNTKNVNAEELIKNLDNVIIIDKNKVLKGNAVIPNNQGQPANVSATAEPATGQATATAEPHKGEPAQAVPAVAEPKKVEEPKSQTSFTIQDVQALLDKQKADILSEIKAEQSKGERDQILDSYINNEKVNSVKDKIDQEKLKQARELYNGLPLNNDQLRTFLDYSIYNPKYANENVYISILALSEANREINQTDIEAAKNKPQGAPKNPSIPPVAAPTNTNKPITDIPAKPNANINMFGTEFKNSADSGNKYNDDYKKGKNFEASSNSKGNEYRPEPTTGKGTPKSFKQYIQ